MGIDSKPLRAKRLYVNLLMAVTILFVAGTASAWILSCEHPWSISVEVIRLGPHGNQDSRNGTWQIRWFNGEAYGDWAWSISGDEYKFDIEPRYSFYEWKIPWWKIILLWLVVPIWRMAPWRSIGRANPDPARISRRYEWLLFKSANRLVSLGRDVKNVLIAHCLGTYLTALVVVLFVDIHWLATGAGFDRNDMIAMAADLLLAPLTILFDLFTLMPNGIDPRFVVALGIYLIAGFGWYLRRTNRLIGLECIEQSSIAS